LTAAQNTEAHVHVAALRGLYGDMAESLHDSAECNDLWSQIEEQQRQLAALITGEASPG
jgi:hypothetical protein